MRGLLKETGMVWAQICSNKGQISHFAQDLVLSLLFLENKDKSWSRSFLNSVLYKQLLYHESSCP